MARDNFSDGTKFKLAIMVGFECVFPGCNRPTHVPNSTHDQLINLGNAAHITAAAKKGPRFDDSLTTEQRKAYENGAWLCVQHATLVDKDPKSYTVQDMLSWQRVAEERRRQAGIEGKPLNANINYQDVCNKLDAFLDRTRKISITWFLHNPTSITISSEILKNIGVLVNQCSGYNWKPSHPLHSLHPQTSALQAQAIRCLSAIRNEVLSGRWHSEFGNYEIRGVRNFPNLQESELQRQIAEVVINNWSEYQACLTQLRTYASGNLFSS